MILCGIALGVLLIVFFACRRMLSEGAKRMLLVAAAGAFLGEVYGIAGREPVLSAGDRLERKAYGEGSYEQELLLRIGDMDEEEMSYTVTVPERRLTEAEETAYLEAAVEELEAEFPGENESVNCIREKVVIRDSYQDGLVEAEWQFDKYRIVDAKGNIVEEALGRGEGTESAADADSVSGLTGGRPDHNGKEPGNVAGERTDDEVLEKKADPDGNGTKKAAEEWADDEVLREKADSDGKEMENTAGEWADDEVLEKTADPGGNGMKKAAEERADDEVLREKDDPDGNETGEQERESSGSGELVRAKVTLSCGDSQMIKEFGFQVYPALLSERERLLRQLRDRLEQTGEEHGTDVLQLPAVIGDHPLSWRTPADHTPEQILLGGLVLAVFVPLLERSRQQEAKKKRMHLLGIEYPDMVSRMALLISAGMTLQGAWKRIAVSYEEKRKQQLLEEKPVFEEMLITCREMESGMGEQRAYERFGERCGLPAYRRFGNLLAQNLQKGSRGLVGLLEQEAATAFEERKSAARRFGEEAGTKLLIPMMMMLGIVMAILLVPAIFAFQI